MLSICLIIGMGLTLSSAYAAAVLGGMRTADLAPDSRITFTLTLPGTSAAEFPPKTGLAL